MKQVFTDSQYKDILRKIKLFCNKTSSPACNSMGACPIRKNCIFTKSIKYSNWEFAQKQLNKIKHYEEKVELAKSKNPFSNLD